MTIQQHCKLLGIDDPQKVVARGITERWITFRPLAAHEIAANLKPLDDEVTMKEWLYREAKRDGVTEDAIVQRLTRGCYPELKFRRVNQRVVFVKV